MALKRISLSNLVKCLKDKVDELCAKVEELSMENITYSLIQDGADVVLEGSDSNEYGRIDICQLVADNCPETVTTISYDNTTNNITYIDEDGNPIILDLNEVVVTDTLVGNLIARVTNEIGDTVDINESVTTLVDNGDGSFTYTSEDGTITTFTQGSDSLVDNGDGTFTHTDVNGNVVTVDFNNSVVTSSNTGNTIATHNDGNGTIVDIEESVTNVTDLNTSGSVNLIGTYNNETGTSFAINETITGLAYTPATQTLTYTKEDGTIDTINLSTLAVDINVASVTYDALTNTLTVTETDSTTHSVDLTDLIDTYTLVDNGDGTATLEDTTGNPSGTINICQMVADGGCTDSLVDNGDGTYTHTALDGTAVIIDTNDILTSISFDSVNNQITYLDEDGNPTVLTLNSGTTSVITNTVVGNRIATHDDGTGNTVDINESDTPITANADGSYSYTSELGTTTIIIDAFHQYVDATGGNKPAITPTTPTGYVGTPKINSTAEVTYDDCIVHYSYDGTTWSIEREDCGSSVEAFNGTQVDATTGRIELGDDAAAPAGGTPAVHISNRFQNIQNFDHTWVGTDDNNLLGVYGSRAISNPDANNTAGNDVVAVGFPPGGNLYKLSVHGRLLLDQGSDSPIIGGTNTVGATANAVLTRTPVLGASTVATSLTSTDSVVIGARNILNGGTNNLSDTAYVGGSNNSNTGTNSFDNSAIFGGRANFVNVDFLNSIGLGGNNSLRGGVDADFSFVAGASSSATISTFPLNGQIAPQVARFAEVVGIGANSSLLNINSSRSVLFGGAQSLWNVGNTANPAHGVTTSIAIGASGSIQNVDNILGSVILAGESSVQGDNGVINGEDRIDGSVAIFGKTSATDGFYYRNAVVLGSTSVGMASDIQQGVAICYAGANNTVLRSTYHVGGGCSYSDIGGSAIMSSQSSASYSYIRSSALLGGVDGRNNGVGHGSEFTDSLIAGTNAGDYASDSDNITSVGTRAYEYGTGNNLSFFGSRANIEWVGSGNIFSWVPGDWSITAQIGTVTNASVTAFIAAEGLAVGDRVTVVLGAGSTIARTNGSLSAGAGASFTVIDPSILQFNGLVNSVGNGSAETNANAGISNSNAIGVDALVSRDDETKLGGTGTIHYRLESLRVYADTATAMADATLLTGDLFRVNDVNGAGQVFQK